MQILVTGGAGYIGSHTCLQLLSKGAQVTVLDNLSSGSCVALKRVERLTGRSIDFVSGDIRDTNALRELFSGRRFDSVIHFAGLKAVGESVEYPLRYFENNVTGTLALLDAMRNGGCKTIIFSSSATVYGQPERLPLTEDSQLEVTNPYGRSKLMVEQILGDLYASDGSWRIARLRYFNPVGAHPSGLIGEDSKGAPNNLMPFISKVASGALECLSVFGGDYPTPDGTGVRDYIHVMDLADGHLAALSYLNAKPDGDLLTVNLGTGHGVSVLELVKAFEHASGRAISYRIVMRRPGDVASCYADTSLAERTLGWKARLNLADMCADAWRWQSTNPHGYKN